VQFLSSRPNLLSILGGTLQDPGCIAFNALETKEIDIYIPTSNSKRNEEVVKVYISDSAGGEKINEILEFQII
jgi:hypothetical protein